MIKSSISHIEIAGPPEYNNIIFCLEALFMTKAIFFDIDGTLVSFDTHRVSPAVLDALQRLRDRKSVV